MGRWTFIFPSWGAHVSPQPPLHCSCRGAEGVIVHAGPRVPWGPGEREHGAAHPPLVPTAAALQGFTHLTAFNSHSSPG